MGCGGSRDEFYRKSESIEGSLAKIKKIEKNTQKKLEGLVSNPMKILSMGKELEGVMKEISEHAIKIQKEMGELDKVLKRQKQEFPQENFEPKEKKLEELQNKTKEITSAEGKQALEMLGGFGDMFKDLSALG